MAAARQIRVLAVQPALRWGQPMPNMHLLRQMIEKELAHLPADLVVLPEVFNGVRCNDAREAGPAARKFLSTLARACGIAVVGGSIDYAHDDGTRRNTCFVVDRRGQEVGSYHKRVLFAGEQGERQTGDGPGVFELAGVQLGVLICADLWDPALARCLLDRVDLVCVPAKTTVPTAGHTDYARRLWWNLALTRAMENALPIVVSDWAAARHEAVSLADGTRVRNVHHTSGGASITNPGRRPRFGEVQTTLPRGESGALSAAIDLDAVAAFRDYRRSVGLLLKRP